MMAASRNGVFIIYTLAILLLVLGVAVAVARFPGGFDWSYTVISKLAST
jgi:ABC-type transporter Mla subunit MlaD